MSDNAPPETVETEVPMSIENTLPVEPEVAQEEVLPPADGMATSPPLKKPPLILAVISMAVIALFITGIALIAAGSKKTDESKQNAQKTVPAIPSATSAPSKPSGTPEELKWTSYTAPSGNFKLNTPTKRTVISSTGKETVDFCKIGSAEATIQITSKDDETINELEVAVARHPADTLTPDEWVQTYCKELLARGTEKGIIDEDGVKGLFYTRKFSNETPDILPYDIAIIQKGKKLFFVYARAKSDEAMQKFFDPMFLSFKLLAK